jgi:hypothetical protein
MKGVILGIAPAARIVDITHEIAPYNLGEAAFVIAQAWTYFPKKTIHVVVVDPAWAPRASDSVRGRRPVFHRARQRRPVDDLCCGSSQVRVSTTLS